MRSLVIALTFGACGGLPAYAQAPTPVEKFYAETELELFRCEGEARISILRAENAVDRVRDTIPDQRQRLDPLIDIMQTMHAEIKNCGTDARSTVKAVWPAAIAYVAKKPAASRLLKDYYAAWTAALDALQPTGGEFGEPYARQKNAASRRSAEIWSRFEIEQ